MKVLVIKHREAGGGCVYPESDGPAEELIRNFTDDPEERAMLYVEEAEMTEEEFEALGEFDGF